MDGKRSLGSSNKALPRVEGHLRGVESVRRIMEACRDLGVEVLTLYCLSSENWKRPAAELEFLLTLLREYLIAERDTLVKNNLRLKIIGRRERMPPEVQDEMDRTLDACSKNTGMTLCLAINYGSRAELVDSVRAIAEQVAAGKLQPSDIEEQTIDDQLYTAGLPDPDLLIRTSGEMRISNFLLWQISYSEAVGDGYRVARVRSSTSRIRHRGILQPPTSLRRPERVVCAVQAISVAPFLVRATGDEAGRNRRLAPFG